MICLNCKKNVSIIKEETKKPDVFITSKLPELNILGMDNAESPRPARMCAKD